MTVPCGRALRHRSLDRVEVLVAEFHIDGAQRLCQPLTGTCPDQGHNVHLMTATLRGDPCDRHLRHRNPKLSCHVT